MRFVRESLAKPSSKALRRPGRSRARPDQSHRCELDTGEKAVEP
jgi:hypothetical protein